MEQFAVSEVEINEVIERIVNEDDPARQHRQVEEDGQKQHGREMRVEREAWGVDRGPFSVAPRPTPNAPRILSSQVMPCTARVVHGHEMSKQL